MRGFAIGIALALLVPAAAAQKADAPAANAIVKTIYLNPHRGPSTTELVEYRPQR